MKESGYGREERKESRGGGEKRDKRVEGQQWKKEDMKESGYGREERKESRGEGEKRQESRGAAVKERRQEGEWIWRRKARRVEGQQWRREQEDE